MNLLCLIWICFLPGMCVVLSDGGILETSTSTWFSLVCVTVSVISLWSKRPFKQINQCRCETCAGQTQGHIIWWKLDDDRSFSSLSAAAFDKKYKAAYTRLSGTLGREELRKKRAQPPSPKAIDCRRSFHPPLECWWSRKQTSPTTAASGVRPSEGDEERRHTQDPCCLHLLVFFTSLLPPGGCRSDALLPVLCSSVCLVDVNPAAPCLHYRSWSWAELTWRVVEKHAERRLCISLNVESCVTWRQENWRSCMSGGISCVAVHFLFSPVF